ncbi:MAG: N-6 DNA methylase [Negativicutes bacterium]|nr:N-6 DNA methylase [Negativicutes bacterium]
MNRKKFFAECHQITEWLSQKGLGEADQILLRILVLIWRGQGPLEAVVAQAIALPSLRQAAGAECLLPVTGDDLPDEIHTILVRWSYNLPCDVWLLGEIHEKLATGRRARGLFYTAPEIIDFIMTHTVEQAEFALNPYRKVLDPACGCGYFLLKAYDVLWKKLVESRNILIGRFPGQDWSDAGIHRHIITHNLWGADIDPLATDIAAASLLLKRPEDSSGLQPNLLVCDSLRRPEENSTGRDKAFWAASYDFVVGNPPYLSFGLRGANRLDPDYEGYLRRAFSASAEYKLSYYVLFMERGIEMLVEGGKLGFIVPDSFLLGRYYSKIRRYILEHTAIEVLAHITAPVFKHVEVGMSAVCVLTKRSDPVVRANQSVAICQAVEKAALQRDTEFTHYGQSYFAGLPYNRFRIFSDLTVKNLIDKIDSNSLRLGFFTTGHTGVRSLTKQSHIVADSSHGVNWRRGLISGSQIQRYGLVYRDHWLNIDPGLLYKGGWDPAVVGDRKILIRQTGHTLTACLDDDGFYHLNNIHSFVRRNGTVSLEYLLMLINSRLLSFYYHAVAIEYGRAMAQTDIDTLELLPVIVQTEADARAVELVGMMQNLVKRQLAGETSLNDKISALDGLLDQLVYRIYGLSDDEIDCVERYEARLIARRRQNRAAAVTALKQ